MVLNLIIAPTHVILRSSLNLIDRYVFGIYNKNFAFFLYLNTFLPFILGVFFLVTFGKMWRFWEISLSMQCFILSASIHLVSFCFLLSLNRWEVRQVALQSKLSDLFLPLIAWCIPNFQDQNTQLFFYLPMILSWAGLIPLFCSQKVVFIFEKTLLLLLASTIFQVIVSHFVKVMHLNSWDSFSFAVGTLFWRTLISLFFSVFQYLVFSKREKAFSFSRFIEEIRSIFLTPWIFKITCARATVVLVVQFTFIIAIANMNPLDFWPILNSTTLVAVLLAKVVLKEKVSWQEWCAFICLSYASAIPLLFRD